MKVLTHFTYQELHIEGGLVLFVGRQEKSASLYGNGGQPTLDVTKCTSSAEAVKKEEKRQQKAEVEVQLLKSLNCILVVAE